MPEELLPLNSEFLMTLSAELGSSYKFGSRAVGHVTGGLFEDPQLNDIVAVGVRYPIHQIL